MEQTIKKKETFECEKFRKRFQIKADSSKELTEYGDVKIVILVTDEHAEILVIELFEEKSFVKNYRKSSRNEFR